MKLKIVISTNFERRAYSAIINSWADPNLKEIIQTLGCQLVEDSVPIDYMLEIEGYTPDRVGEMLQNIELSDYYNIYAERIEDLSQYELIYDINEKT